jgi:hypothetical protein
MSVAARPTGAAAAAGPDGSGAWLALGRLS